MTIYLKYPKTPEKLPKIQKLDNNNLCNNPTITISHTKLLNPWTNTKHPHIYHNKLVMASSHNSKDNTYVILTIKPIKNQLSFKKHSSRQRCAHFSLREIV